MASTVLQIRIDDSLKKDAAELYESLGMNLSSAIKLFLNRSIVEQGLPFPMNKEIKKVHQFDINAFLKKYWNE